MLTLLLKTRVGGSAKSSVAALVDYGASGKLYLGSGNHTSDGSLAHFAAAPDATCRTVVRVSSSHHDAWAQRSTS